MDIPQQNQIRILHMIGSLNVGGSQSMVMNLYRNIDRNKFQFDFIIDRPNELFHAKEIEELGGNIYYLPTFDGGNLNIVKESWKSFLTEHSNYDVVHFHVRSYISLIIPVVKKFGIPVISHSHSISSGTGIKAKIKNILQVPIRFQADYFLACSDEAGKWLFGKNILKNKNYHTVKNAIDGEKYFFNPKLRNELRESFGITNSQIVIGNVGRASKVKNQVFLIDIFNEIQKKIDAKLLLIGDGDTLLELKNKVENLGIQEKCIFLGNVYNVSDYYNAMDIFVFPSLWEGLGISVVEAETNGLKCFISQNVPDSVDIGANLIEVINLEKNESNWCNEIIQNLESERISPKDDFYNSGYDICSISIWYQNFYASIKNLNS